MVLTFINGNQNKLVLVPLTKYKMVRYLNQTIKNKNCIKYRSLLFTYAFILCIVLEEFSQLEEKGKK